MAGGPPPPPPSPCGPPPWPPEQHWYWYQNQHQPPPPLVHGFAYQHGGAWGSGSQAELAEALLQAGTERYAPAPQQQHGCPPPLVHGFPYQHGGGWESGGQAQDAEALLQAGTERYTPAAPLPPPPPGVLLPHAPPGLLLSPKKRLRLSSSTPPPPGLVPRAPCRRAAQDPPAGYQEVPQQPPPPPPPPPAPFVVPRRSSVVAVALRDPSSSKPESSYTVRMRGTRCTPAEGLVPPRPRISNLPADLLGDAPFVVGQVAQCKSVLERTDLPPDHLVLRIAEETLEVLEALDATTFPEWIINSYPLQTTRSFPDAASFDSDPTARHVSFPLKEDVRRVWDSLMIRLVDPLLKGPIGSFGGNLQLYHVLVHGTECTLLLRPTEFGNAHNIRRDFSRVHAWLSACFPPGPCRPPLLDHLLALLLDIPPELDTSPTVREQYLLSVRNHMSLASFARQQTLLINYGKLIKCLEPPELAKLEAAMSAREKTTGKPHAWREFVDAVKLMNDVSTRADTGKVMLPFKKTDSLYDLSHFLRVFEVHAPQYVLDTNHHPVLMHFEEVHAMMESYFKDDLAELYIALLPAVENPLVKSTCKCFENRG